jgi:hypothetical protein
MLELAYINPDPPHARRRVKEVRRQQNSGKVQVIVQDVDHFYQWHYVWELIQGGRTAAILRQRSARGLELLNKLNTLSKEEFVVWSLLQSKKKCEEQNADPDSTA